MIVQDHQIKLQALHPQVLVSTQKLTGHQHILFAFEPQDHDRQIAADALPPERRLRESGLAPAHATAAAAMDRYKEFVLPSL